MTAVPEPSRSPPPTTAAGVSGTVVPTGCSVVSLLEVEPGSRVVTVAPVVDEAGPTVGLSSLVHAVVPTARTTARRPAGSRRRIAATLATWSGASGNLHYGHRGNPSSHLDSAS